MEFLLVSAESRAGLRLAAKTIRDNCDLETGDPIVTVSLLRLIVSPGVLDILGFTSPDQLQALLSPIAGIRVTDIPESRALELLDTRNGPEISVPRLEPSIPGVGGKFSWHLHKCKFPDAWEQIAPGNFGAIPWGTVLVGQIDTGYSEHPALGFEDTGQGFVQTSLSRNYYPPEMPPASDHTNDGEDPFRGGAFDGHGTRTGSVLSGYYVRSGLAGGLLNGYFGAAPRVPYVPVRISDSVFISHVQDELAKAILYLVSIQCRVISLSMGFPLIAGGGVRPQLKQAVNAAYDAGVIFVCAAGNVVRNVVAPAALSRTIAVGGSTPNDVPWSGGSRGEAVDVCAPAWPIYRATVDNGEDPRYVFGFGDGTSFATAMVAGAAALWLVKHGGAIAAAYPAKWQVVEAFKQTLQRTARRPFPTWDTTRFGEGILDADALLSSALPTTGLSMAAPA